MSTEILQRMNRTDQKAAMAYGDDIERSAFHAVGHIADCVASDHSAVRTSTGKFENEDVFVDLVDEKPIGYDVVLAVGCPIADERMGIVLGRRFSMA